MKMENVIQTNSKPQTPVVSKVNGKSIKKAKLFIFSDFSKIAEWDKCLPPQARDTYKNITKFGIKFGEKVDLKTVHSAYIRMEKEGILRTRQAPGSIFDYYRQWYRGEKGTKVLMTEVNA